MDEDNNSMSSTNSARTGNEKVLNNFHQEESIPVSSIIASRRYIEDNESEEDLARCVDLEEDNDVDVVDDDETNSFGTGDSSRTPIRKRSLSETSPPGTSATMSFKKTSKKCIDGQRQPAVRDLTIPYRAIKRTMKLDPSVGIVQNEASILVTYATELFIKKLARESYEISMKKGRGTIKYDDVAEARVKNKSFSFLNLLLP